MTDIWDEKPKSKSDKFHDGTATHRFYEEKAMDAWLEKLQDEMLSAWTKDENRLTKVIIERGRKLEAIKTHFENRPMYHDSHVADWMIELKKILEAS